jgi:hypothetical protein
MASTCRIHSDVIIAQQLAARIALNDPAKFLLVGRAEEAVE